MVSLLLVPVGNRTLVDFQHRRFMSVSGGNLYFSATLTMINRLPESSLRSNVFFLTDCLGAIKEEWLSLV